METPLSTKRSTAGYCTWDPDMGQTSGTGWSGSAIEQHVRSRGGYLLATG
jgi:hypothetical protein